MGPIWCFPFQFDMGRPLIDLPYRILHPAVPRHHHEDALLYGSQWVPP